MMWLRCLKGKASILFASLNILLILFSRYDFFLVSQSVRQGTVNPTSYNVIKDTSGLEAKHIQALTYKLTHLYYNWPGQYAQIVPSLRLPGDGTVNRVEI